MVKRTFLIRGASKGIDWAVSERLITTDQHVVGLARNIRDFPGELLVSDRAATQ